MNFELVPKENPRNVFIEHCVNKGNNFEVEIIHWHLYETPQPEFIEMIGGNECWNVYAIIHKEHPLYKTLKNLENDDYFKAEDLFPFHMHGGITYVKNENDCIKLGDDYIHWGDESFQIQKELPCEVKHEAEELFEYLRRNEL